MESAPEERTLVGWLRKHPNKAVFGPMSLYVFGAAVAIALFFFLTAFGHSGSAGFGYMIFGIMLGCFACVLNIVFAIIGLVRRECPRWPAITGLALSLLPALGAIYILCGAPW